MACSGERVEQESTSDSRKRPYDTLTVDDPTSHALRQIAEGSGGSARFCRVEHSTREKIRTALAAPIAPLELGSLLGKGTFGAVNQATDPLLGVVAVKQAASHHSLCAAYSSCNRSVLNGAGMTRAHCD